MKRFLIAMSAVAAVAGTVAAQKPDSTIAPLDAVVAVVGNTPITRYDIEQRLADTVRAMRARKQPMPSEEKRREIVLSVLNSLIDEEVLLYKAKEMQVEVSDADVTTFIDQQIKEISARFPSTAEFRKELLAAGFGTPEEYRRFMSAQYRRDKTIESLVHKLMAPGEKQIPSVTVPEARVQQEFDHLKSSGVNLKRLATVVWRQMVIAPSPSPAAKAAARSKVDSLHAEIAAGADFEHVAKRESMDAATKDLGGDLGWRRRGQLPEELERLVFGPFSIRPGDISAVTESPYGFHILRLDRANPPAEVKVRQILIIPKIDSADVTRAAKLADSLVAALRKGALFDTIAHHFHDLAEDAPGLMPELARDSLPQSYQVGLNGVGMDSIVAFPIPAAGGFPKYVIAQVVKTTEAGDYSYDEVKLRIRANLQQVSQMRRYIDSQRKSIYVMMMPLERAYLATSIFDRAGPPPD
jgi:peptidyl-prolyl cis-trans isomerase SurA